MSGGQSRASLKRKASKLKSKSFVESSKLKTSEDTNDYHDKKNKQKRSEEDRDISDSFDSFAEYKVSGVDSEELKMPTRDVSNLTYVDILYLSEPDEVLAEERASMLMSKILGGTSRKRFYTKHWEKSPLLIERDDRSHFKGLFSRKQFKTVLKDYSVYYGVELDVSKYNTHGNKSFIGTVVDNNVAQAPPSGVGNDQNQDTAGAILAKTADVWKCYEQGYAIRLLCPQKYDDMIWRFLSSLEPEFNSFIGCEADMLPSGGQGYCPTIASAESIVLQIAGKSRWHLWKPKEGAELPLGDPTDFKVEADESSDESKPSMNRLLHAGDTLYIPRGWAYETSNATLMGDEDTYSLHMRLYTGQDNSIADLLRNIVPTALETLAVESLSARQALPRKYANYMGLTHSEVSEETNPSLHSLRSAFMAHSASVLTSTLNVALQLIDAGADQMSKKFISQRLPIPLTSQEEERSSAGASDAKIFIYTKLRMLRPGIARVLVEDDVCVVYHCMDNSRELYGAPLQPLEFDLDDGPPIDMLLSAYPESVCVSDLPHPSEDEDDKIAVAQALFKEGFLVITDDASKPVASGEDSDDSSDPF